MIMTHDGLGFGFALAVWIFMIGISARLFLGLASVGLLPAWRMAIVDVPFIGNIVNRIFTASPTLGILKLVFAGLFVLILLAGLLGTPIPERNLATVLTWNVWWTGLILLILFIGSVWCAVCPWNAIAGWLVRRNRLKLRMPKVLRSIWPAFVLLVALTWLELGARLTVSPYATSVLALSMLFVVIACVAVFERRAFCRYLCPVGRTVGFYSQLSGTALRPIDADTCRDCRSLDCYHGSEPVEACPTHLVMGTLDQSTYCTSCGNCAQSCPHRNVGWRARLPGRELITESRPRFDEAWFLLGLLALTIFHGLTMLEPWQGFVNAIAEFLGDDGSRLISFSIGLGLGLAAPIALFLLTVALSCRLGGQTDFRQRFSSMAFMTLPLAFAYHLAHNLTHLVRESHGLIGVLANPFGTGALPLSAAEIHQRHMQPLIGQDILFSLQALLMALGFLIAVRVAVARGSLGVTDRPRKIPPSTLPQIAFAVAVTGFNLWMLMQPMTMRM